MSSQNSVPVYDLSSPAAVSHDVILIPTALDPSSRTFYLIPLVFFIVSIFRHNYLIVQIGLFSTSSLFAETMPYVTQTGLTLWAQEMLLPQPPGTWGYRHQAPMPGLFSIQSALRLDV